MLSSVDREHTPCALAFLAMTGVASADPWDIPPDSLACNTTAEVTTDDSVAWVPWLMARYLLRPLASRIQ